MKCAWESFLKLLPLWMRDKVDKFGKERLRELRLRINAPPELVFAKQSYFLERNVKQEDIRFCINMATKYSPWSAESVSAGFITIPGGHRIGLCGAVIADGASCKGFSSITSICIRIARDFIGIAKDVLIDGSALLVGRPGSGKTTLLRDLVRQLANQKGNRVAVVDERYEIFPSVDSGFCFETGPKIDVISGCNKAFGIETVIRTMTPTIIAVDEITAQTDADAMLKAIGCGVSIIATAHATNFTELKMRPIYQTLLERKVFNTFIVLSSDANWHLERIAL